jgi:6-phosphogluconolactonase
MKPAEPDVRWQVLGDADSVADQAARRILEAASAAIAGRGLFRIVLAGGRTPAATYRLLIRAETDWSRWMIYFGDERCLPPDDADRNSSMASKAWLNAVDVPAANIHAIPAELGSEAAAEAYAPLVQAALPFDLVLLGIGEDGHTAGLFPGQQHPPDQLVHAVHDAPKPPADRVSLSARALSEAREVLVLATGAGKRAAIRAWRAGAQLPVARIGDASTPVVVLMDEAAQA